ncbi:hypothetical protein GBA52_011867 [Prunus armeniaca]|nr:hypothetical protein GBA52_011867 [Prunus armeniaca]
MWGPVGGQPSQPSNGRVEIKADLVPHKPLLTLSTTSPSWDALVVVNSCALCRVGGPILKQVQSMFFLDGADPTSALGSYKLE